MHIKYTSIVFVLTFLFSSCGGTVIPSNPIQEMKTDFVDKEAYTIILEDMDLRENQYFHKYKVFDLLNNNEVNVEVTDWKVVDDDFFLLHEDDLGMEIFSKNKNGMYNNLVTPPGFTHFVGNEDFGQWSKIDTFNINPDYIEQMENDRSWIFYDQSNGLSLQKELGLSGLSIKKEEYRLFTETYYLNRPFYGEKITTDTTKYGTRSRHWVIIRPLFYSRRVSKKNFDKPYGGAFSYENRGGGGFGK